MKTIYKRMLSFFFQGVMVLTPILLTFYFAWLLFHTLNRLVFAEVGRGLGSYFHATTTSWLTTLLGLITTILLLILTGAFARNVIGRYFVNFFIKLMNRMPIVKILYTTIRDVLQAVMGEKKKFDKPVLVQLTSVVSVAGFITAQDLSAWSLPGRVAVYLPQSLNFAGNLLLVEKDSVHSLDVPSAQLMTFIVSGGMTGQSDAAIKPQKAPSV